MMIRRTPQARITNQGVNPVGEGKADRVAGAAVTHAAIRYPNTGRKRGEVPLKDEAARARAGILLSAAAAWHPLWLKWRVSLGEPHRPDSPTPPAQNLGGGVPGLQAPRFRPAPRKPAPHSGRRDPEGGGAAPGCPDPCHSQLPHSAANQCQRETRCETVGWNHDCLQRPDGVPRSPAGASSLRSPITASKTGTPVFTSAAPAASPGPSTPAICCGACRRSTSSTPGTYTRAAPIRCGCWTRFPMNCPSRRSTVISSTGRSRQGQAGR